ncbi:MAG TPA: SPFH domain-containing protein [Streptosporangiaceae bacterium]|nr:SPFH domain-containing protein [Streptosporangiaceae bacterium]
MGDLPGIVAGVIALLVVLVILRSVRIVPQARARNVERLGRYTKTLEPGMNMIMPFIDRVKPLIDLREQVVSFLGQPVITEDNLVVKIDTVLFFQVTDPRAADYEIVNYIQAIEQLTATMLRSVIGSMDLEVTLTSRDKINTMLRGVLDDASGKWGIRVTRVEIKAIDPPKSVIDAMEKQMRAEREKRAAILTAEGLRQAQILTADGDKQGTVLRAEGEKQSAILKAEGQAQAISSVFQSIHTNDPDPKLLAYQYLQTLPQIAQGPGNTMWMIPSELTSALKALSSAFDGGTAAADTPSSAPSAQEAAGASGPSPALTAGSEESAADAALAEVVLNEAALAGNAVPEQPQAALAAAMAAVPEPPAPPEVPLPEALLRPDAVQEDPSAANGAAAGPA